GSSRISVSRSHSVPRARLNGSNCGREGRGPLLGRAGCVRVSRSLGRHWSRRSGHEQDAPLNVTNGGERTITIEKQPFCIPREPIGNQEVGHGGQAFAGLHRFLFSARESINTEDIGASSQASS